MGSGCTAHSSIHVMTPGNNNRAVTDRRKSTDEQIKYRKEIIFQEGEDSFLQLSSPRSGKSIIWRKGELIGEGAYAKVYQCINLNTGELLAVKSFILGDDPKKIEKEFNNMRKEVSVLKRLTHENVIKYYQTDLSKDFYSIDVLLEYVPGGSLKNILNKYQALELDIIKMYGKQILKGLKYLHENQIVHRDLKSANILISFNGTVKLTDFGSSAIFENNKEKLTRSLRGSPYWMAPEVVLRKGHSYPADIWSFGCVLIEMATGRPPWSNYSKETKQVLSLIAKEGSLPDTPIANPELLEIIKSCISREPENRPDVVSLLSSPFFYI